MANPFNSCALKYAEVTAIHKNLCILCSLKINGTWYNWQLALCTLQNKQSRKIQPTVTEGYHVTHTNLLHKKFINLLTMATHNLQATLDSHNVLKWLHSSIPAKWQ